MPQMQLPLIPRGTKSINNIWSVDKTDDRVTYFCGINPVFMHDANCLRSFQMFTAQLVSQGACRPIDVIKAFGVTKSSVSRSVAKYKSGGPASFFKARRGRSSNVITEEVKAQLAELFASGMTPKEAAKELDIRYETLRKAITQKRVTRPIAVGKVRGESEASDKSTRSLEDAQADMGNACTRVLERVTASLGLLPGGAETRFEHCRDVKFGGLLCALPALVKNGLLSHLDECFEMPAGYYTIVQVLLLVGYMALCRIKVVEQLQEHSPGELGKIMGLDRVPEVRCLRNKLAKLSEDDAPAKWSRLLSLTWMEDSPELVGTLYVDGHVRVYHGGKTELPKRFVSREKLCLRGTTDYWINDALGQPFFLVSRPVDRGMLEALRTDIVPRLLKDVPGQPSAEQLESDPHLSRFTIVFDREGYSPVFFKEMWEKHRIACITYHKFPGDDWPEECFNDTQLEMPNGEQLTMKLAEMGSWIGSKKDGLWVREVRKLCKGGHQTSLISSAKGAFYTRDAALIFSRWSQENFFAYMEKHFAIDLLSEYGTEGFTGPQQVVNPVFRELERQSRSVTSKLNRRKAKFGEMGLHPEIDDRKLNRWKKKKEQLVEEIERFEHELNNIKQQQKETPRHLDWKELPEEQKFERLKPSRKHLVDTVKMIAYRAETAMTNIVREKLAKKDTARTLIQDLCRCDADILPDENNGTLTIQIHSFANARSNRAIKHLLDHLNESEFNYPGTKLKLLYRLAAPD
jgi:transposase